MNRRFDILAGALALAVLLSSLASGVAHAQSTPIANRCTADASCFVFTPAYTKGPASIDLYVDSKLVAQNVGISNSSAVIPVTAGTHWLQLPASGSAPSAATITGYVSFSAGAIYDLVLRDSKGTARLSTFPIDPTAPAAGLSRSRVVNLWPGLGTVDVELGDPGDKTGLDANSRFLGVGQTGASGYVESGTFSKLAAVLIYPANSATSKWTLALRDCPAASICSYILIGPAGKSKTPQYSLAVFPA